jgi:cytochrome c oxidase cbb3-type subunit III
MSKIGTVLLFIGLVLNQVSLFAQTSTPQDKGGHAVKPSADAFSRGKAFFQQRCGFCHGPDALGATGPDLLRSSLVLHDEDGSKIGPVIRNGRSDKGMPAFNLSETQIREIAAFLHARIKFYATIFSKNSALDYPTQKLLVGNAQAGKAYFYGEGKCSSCHSPTGDLAHIASKYGPIDLEKRIVYPSGRAPTVTVTLPSGKNISGAQVYADAFLVSLRDAEGWVHTYQRSEVKVQIDDPLAAHQALLSKYTDKNIHDLFAFMETLK